MVDGAPSYKGQSAASNKMVNQFAHIHINMCFDTTMIFLSRKSFDDVFDAIHQGRKIWWERLMRAMREQPEKDGNCAVENPDHSDTIISRELAEKFSWSRMYPVLGRQNIFSSMTKYYPDCPSMTNVQKLEDLCLLKLALKHPPPSLLLPFEHPVIWSLVHLVVQCSALGVGGGKRSGSPSAGEKC